MIPSTVTDIGYNAFYNCQNLSTINFNATSCNDCNSGTFYNAGKNQSSLIVTFGSGVKRIPAKLFYVSTDYNNGNSPYAHITSVSIPSSVTRIAKEAFNNCYDLKNLTINSKSTVFEDAYFTGGSKSLTIKCYYGSTAYNFAKKNGYKISYLKPATPTVSGITNSASGITIKWNKTNGASGYYVYRKTVSGNYSKIKTISNGNTISYTDTSIKSKNGTTYTYAVKAYAGSAVSSSYTSKTIVRLTGVNLSKATNINGKKITIKWTKNSKATGYQIQYSTSNTFSSKNKTITIDKSTSNSKTISGLIKNKNYYLRIRVYKTVSGVKYYSSWSGKKQVKINK
jgi:hypothetical protein